MGTEADREGATEVALEIGVALAIGVALVGTILVRGEEATVEALAGMIRVMEVLAGMIRAMEAPDLLTHVVIAEARAADVTEVEATKVAKGEEMIPAVEDEPPGLDDDNANGCNHIDRQCRIVFTLSDSSYQSIMFA